MWRVVLVALGAAPKNVLALIEWIHDRPALFEHTFGLTRLPSRATLYRFLNTVNVAAVEGACETWLRTLDLHDFPPLRAHDDLLPHTASVDGKRLVGTGRTRTAAQPLLCCAAYLHQLGVPVMHAFTPDFNEHGAAKRALSALRELGVKLLVADAGYCGHSFAAAVHDAGLCYLLPLKNNQQDSLDWARFALSYPASDTATFSERRSGETWTWTLEISHDVPEVLCERFVGVRTLLRLTRHVVLDRGGERSEVQHALSSATLDAPSLLAAWRGHWGIENRVHHVRDTVFGEDQCRAREAGPTLAALRNLILVAARQLGLQTLRFTRAFDADPRQLWTRLGWLPQPWTQS